MAPRPAGANKLLASRARSLAKPAIFRIRLIWQNCQQIFRSRYSLRSIRPESDEISFSLYSGDVNRPRNSTSYTAQVVTTGARNRSSLHCFGPTSMRKSESRSEQDDHGTFQTSIRHRPQLRSAMRYMRLLPFTPAASQCAMSDLGMQPESRSRS